MEDTSFCLRHTSFGPVAVLWSVRGKMPGISRILLSRPGAELEQYTIEHSFNIGMSSCGEIDAMAGRIASFLGGEDVKFELDTIRLDLCSDFQRRVLLVECAIPRGRTSTYGLIAKHLSIPAGARAVGRALATNPFPVIIPCHRAIRSDGTLGGYQGGIHMKRKLLVMEGVAFRETGQVESGSFFYDTVQKR